jgi:hypothetical protein
MFRSAGCSFLRAEGFSCSLCVLYGGLGLTKLQFFCQKTEKSTQFWSAKIFFQFLIKIALNQCGSTTLGKAIRNLQPADLVKNALKQELTGNV